MKIIIAHGSFGKPHENWIPWLEEKLDAWGIEYLTPTFPTPMHQNYHDWALIMDLYKQFGCFDDNSVFVGHSCGAIFLAKYIIDRKIHCKGYISVSGYNNFWSNDSLMNRLNGSFYDDDEVIKELPQYVQNVISFHSDNDPFIPQERLKEFSTLVSSKEVIIKNGGHINKAAGMLEFELLADVIKSIIEE